MEKARFLNLLWVPHYHRAPINLIVIKQLLCLVHYGCQCLEDSIPITDMLIHMITLLPHSGLNPTKALGRKTGKRDLAERMTDKFKLVKKLHGYSISSINSPVVKVDAQILVGKIMRKCHVDEVPTLVVSLVVQCAKGVQFNWVHYLCSDFLVNCREATDQRNTSHYSWILLSIVLVAWKLLEDSQFPLMFPW